MTRWLLPALALALPAPARATQPIIDVHRHASWPGEDDAAARSAMLAEMDSTGVVLALLHINEPGDVPGWLRAAPGRFIGGPAMPCPPTPRKPFYRCFADTGGWPDLAWLESELAAGRIGMLGEMLFVYVGVHPDDARMRPYWALAAKYDVPVAIHINRGPPPGSGPRRDPRCCPAFDGEMGNPALLRPVLERHPRLRLLLQHAGTGSAPGHLPFHSETLALLRDYPALHVDLSILNSAASPAQHERELKRLIRAGFERRIMFGSDNRPVAPIIKRMNAIGWLTARQRRAIFYGNAARFLRLDRGTIALHRRQVDKRLKEPN